MSRARELMFIYTIEFIPLKQIEIHITCFAEFHSRYKYLLVKIDIFSKLVSLIPLARPDEALDL